MSLKARLRLSIVAFVTIVVIAISAIYLYNFTSLAFEAASLRASLVADQVMDYVLERIAKETAARHLHPANIEESERAWAEILRTDPEISGMLKRTLGNADVVAVIAITDSQGRALAASNSYLVGTDTPQTESFDRIATRNWFRNLWDLQTHRIDYSVTLPIGVQGKPLFHITVAIWSVLLRHALEPAFTALAVTFSIALLVAILLAAILPNVLVAPIQRVSESIDQIASGHFDRPVPAPTRETREFAAVQSKLSLLGQQFKGAQQDASQLRTNIEHLLQRLDEAVLLFDADGKLIAAGDQAERLLDKNRSQILGAQIDQVFPLESALGAHLQEAMHSGVRVSNQPVNMTRLDGTQARVLLNVEALTEPNGRKPIGTLVTLRDAETRKQLRSQLDISSRLAAISRLTSGVAHEIKNPLNAMALHLEVLKSRLDDSQPEIEVISREIKRLDNVVKTFLSFTKPIEIQSSPVDLSLLVKEVETLVTPHARESQVMVITDLRPETWVNGDFDLLKQALLNVVINGIEAMPNGGQLKMSTVHDGRDCEITISDSGPGITPEAQDKVFNLYFTTKEGGSGIGLAMTFRVVQLHGGTISFATEPGKGTTFRVQFPELTFPHGQVLSHAQSLS
jgi:signal transduction histidine kinase